MKRVSFHFKGTLNANAMEGASAQEVGLYIDFTKPQQNTQPNLDLKTISQLPDSLRV